MSIDPQQSLADEARYKDWRFRIQHGLCLRLHDGCERAQLIEDMSRDLPRHVPASAAACLIREVLNCLCQCKESQDRVAILLLGDLEHAEQQARRELKTVGAA